MTRLTPNQTNSTSGALRVLAYCHDGVGIGHLRRTLTICEHIARTNERVSFLAITGSPYISLLGTARGHKAALPVDFLKLPALSKVDNETYCAKFLSLSNQEVVRCREALLLETTRQFAPDVVLVDKAPAGVRGELRSTLEWLRERSPATRLIFGMRDIEDEPETTIRQWSELGALELFDQYYDEIWVYGMRGLFDVGETYRLSRRTRAKLRYMGYLVRPGCDHAVSSSNGVRQVLVTVGGGTDGAHILETFLAETARALAAEGMQSTIVAGPDLPPEQAERLGAIARRIPGTTWVDFEPCMLCRIRRADVVVTMGGYNTLCEIAMNRKPAIVIPRTTPRLEQAMRAALWAERDAVEVLDAAQATPASLARAVSRVLSSGIRVTAPKLDLGGLDRVFDRFNAICGDKMSHASSVCL